MNQRGFSLIELAIALLILSLLLGGLLNPFAIQMTSRNQKDTDVLLREIQDSLIGFAITHNARFPCASDVIDSTQASYGLEDCTHLTEGYLPWREIGLNNPLDPWGNPWRYRVDVNFSVTQFSLNTAFSDNLAVVDVNGNGLTGTVADLDPEYATLIIYSTGANGQQDGGNLSADNIYQGGNRSENFDDHIVWISRAQVFRMLTKANILP